MALTLEQFDALTPAQLKLIENIPLKPGQERRRKVMKIKDPQFKTYPALFPAACILVEDGMIDLDAVVEPEVDPDCTFRSLEEVVEEVAEEEDEDSLDEEETEDSY